MAVLEPARQNISEASTSPVGCCGEREAMAAGIALIPQEVMLARHLTVRANIVLGQELAVWLGELGYELGDNALNDVFTEEGVRWSCYGEYSAFHIFTNPKEENTEAYITGRFG